jgi:hypothetical protein
MFLIVFLNPSQETGQDPYLPYTKWFIVYNQLVLYLTLH